MSKEKVQSKPASEPNSWPAIQAKRGKDPSLPESSLIRRMAATNTNTDLSHRAQTMTVLQRRVGNQKARSLFDSPMQAKGEYDPNHAQGKALLAPELTHVMQQNRSDAKTTVQRQSPARNRQAGGDRFDRLHPGRNPRGILEQLNPGRMGRLCQMNCPATAAAVDTYLRTGNIEAAHCDPMRERVRGFGYTVPDRFGRSLRWRPARRQIFARTRRHGHFVVVEGDRGPNPTGGLTRYHYFVVLNIRGTRFVIDAFLRQVDDDIPAYIRNLGTRRYKLVQGAFQVRPTGGY